MEVMYALFERATLDDQRKYYQNTVKRSRAAARQVNRIRAMFAWLTGFSAAAAGLLVMITDPACASQLTAEAAGCPLVPPAVGVLLVLAVFAPAMGAAFGTLADLYQWDRLVKIYEVAVDNLEVADAKSPVPEMDDAYYRASLKAYAEGTLSVMRDESAQWGQIIRTPETIQRFIEQELQTTERAVAGLPEGIQKVINEELDRLRSERAALEQELETMRARLRIEAAVNAPPTDPPAAG
jgi:hypothetical protein